MRRTGLLLIVFSFAALAQPQVDERRVVSPDGQIEFKVFVSSQPDSALPRLAYQVSYRGKVVVDTSFLGFDIYDQEPLLGESDGLTASDSDARGAYKLLTAHYMQNGSQGRLLDIETRVYNDAVAFRYVVPKSTPLKSLQIADEATEFDVPHEEGANLALPFFAKQESGVWVGITEIPVEGYPRMTLKHEDDGALLARLTRPPGTRVPDIVFDGVPPLTSPWRIILIGSDKNALLQSKAFLPEVAIRWPHLDAHNCYPYEGQYQNRLDRALATGFPVAIEQDIAYYNGKAVVTHTAKTTGVEPALKEHFFEHVRPIIEKALRDNHRDQWPLIVLHFDFKDLQAPLLHEVWKVLGEYEPWITTAKKSSQVEPLDIKPLLVLTEEADEQEAVFFNEVPDGGTMRIFGSAHTKDLTAPANDYRRWLNYSWQAVETEGQSKTGPWSEEKRQRLQSLVDNAHRLGYRIRFYTLDGFTPAESQGWFEQYNFGSRAAVETRWKAALDAGVDLIATDQYEALSAFLAATGAGR